MKYALVTGASRGIGREVALELSRHVYFVFLCGRDIVSLEETKSLISKENGNSKIIAFDLQNPNEIKEVKHKVLETTEHLDILANIAGMYHDESRHFFNIDFEEYPDEAIVKNINGILIGHILLTKYLVSLMVDGSSIINMSGKFDEGETGVISDFITKNAIEIFTKQLPLELKNKKIRVNAVSPGFVYTESVKKFFPEVLPENTLEPKIVAQKIVEIATDPDLNGKIIEIDK